MPFLRKITCILKEEKIVADTPAPKTNSEANSHSVPVVISSETSPVPDKVNSIPQINVSVHIIIQEDHKNKLVDAQQVENKTEKTGKLYRNELRKIEANRWNAISSGSLLAGFIIPMFGIYTKIRYLIEIYAKNENMSLSDVAQIMFTCAALLSGILISIIAARKSKESLQALED